MDLRDIQRLHAQFSPDTITIDLPRQIAALPAPTVFGSSAPSPSVKSRWIGAAPVVRASIIAIAVATLVGMAGMGAASLYKASRYAAPSSGSLIATVPARHTAASNDEAHLFTKPISKDIDATPAQPVDAAPRLTASDLAASSSLGLTADEFRSSLRSQGLTNQVAANNRSETATSNEMDRAANSPIRRAPTPRTQEQSVTAAAAAQIAPTAPAAAVSVQAVPKPIEPVVVQSVPQQSVSVTRAVASQAMPITPASQSDAPAVKTAHPVRHHVSKVRSAQNEDTATASPSAAPAQTGPSARTGSNEVQMF